MTKQAKVRHIRTIVAKEARAATELADAIADWAEPGFQETKSADAIADYLAGHGFTVERPWRQMPTAFRAFWGKGRPSIGILAEYDALPDCGAKPGTWGHGCGHNLLGAGSAVGAVAAKGLLEAKNAPGQIVVWGCPAEETLAGKVYMARDDAFRENDAILGWHPGSNGVGRFGGSAMNSTIFEFFGKTAHGASAHSGRSALDGVMLLDVAANYLREHVPDNVRIHMCVRDGGHAPNVVPAYAKAWYYVRGKDRTQVDDVHSRLVACARGAAMATGTKVKIKLLTAIYNRLPNDVLGDLVLANLDLFGPPKATPKDKALVKKLGKKPEFNEAISKERGAPGKASSDEDTISWLAPFGRFGIACTSKGITGHHRDYAAQAKLPFAHRGVLRAAEVFAGTVFDLSTDRKLMRKAKAEFKKRTKDFTFDPLVPKRQKPPTVDP